jgi:twitching motility protein PilT
MDEGDIFTGGPLFEGKKTPYDDIIPPRSAPDMDRVVGELGQLDGLSDIWLSQGQFLRIKRHNEIQVIESLNKINGDLLAAWLGQLLKDVKWSHNIDAAHSVPTASGDVRFRVNAYSQVGELRVCLRLINGLVPHYKTLNIPASVVKTVTSVKDGLAFFVGSTGSGKSTSIASLLTERATTRTGHIITLEDPIEYRFADANSFFSQRQKGEDFDTFADALKAALRQAPDDIMIGEIRDSETAEIALHAAETGHFVLTTLHTKRAPEAINRFKLLFPEGQQKQIGILMANLLRFVVCQRLIRNTEGKRMALFEVMHVSNESGIRPLLRSDKISQIYSAMDSSGMEDNMSFERHLEEIYGKKLITQRLYTELREELELERS